MAEVRFETDLRLDRLLVSDKRMESKVRSIVRKVLSAAVDTVRGRIRTMSGKDAYLALRKSVYKRVLGGNLNIISPHRAGGQRVPLPPESPRKRSHAVGGNRMARSRRTEDLLTYAGVDRGFILRFLNGGTPGRTSNGTRNVGQITPRNWFGSMTQQEIERQMQLFDKLMDELIQEEFNKR